MARKSIAATLILMIIFATDSAEAISVCSEIQAQEIKSLAVAVQDSQDRIFAYEEKYIAAKEEVKRAKRKESILKSKLPSNTQRVKLRIEEKKLEKQHSELSKGLAPLHNQISKLSGMVQKELAKIDELINKEQNFLMRLSKSIENLEYQISVALRYGDNLAAEKIRSSLKQKAAEKLNLQEYLNSLLARRRQIEDNQELLKRQAKLTSLQSILNNNFNRRVKINKDLSGKEYIAASEALSSANRELTGAEYILEYERDSLALLLKELESAENKCFQN